MRECITINSLIDSRPFIYMISSALSTCEFSVAVCTHNERMLSIIDEDGYNAIRNIQFIPATDSNVDDLIEQVKDQFDFILVDNMSTSENNRYVCLMPFVVEDLIEYDLNIKNEKNPIIIFYGKSLIKKVKKPKNKDEIVDVWELKKQEDAIIESLQKSVRLEKIPEYSDLVGFEKAGKLLSLSDKEANFFIDFFKKYINLNPGNWKRRVMKNHECTIKTNASVLW